MNAPPKSQLRVTNLEAGAEGRWDSFVLSCAEATFFHRAGWRRVIEQSFGHACHYVFAESDGAIRGVLPLVHVKSLLFGNSLISNAFCVYGGPAGKDDDARKSLVRYAEELASVLRVDYLEFRSRARTQPGWACNSELYAGFRKELDPDPNKNLLALSKRRRSTVRKGIKLGLTSVVDDDIDRFFQIYSTSVRNLGTPVFAKSYFRNIKATFGDDCEILVVLDNGHPVSSIMSFYFRNEVHTYYAGGTAEARPLNANDFAFWEVMRRATERGCRTFDMGRSKRGTGSFAFKCHWGIEPLALHYEYKLLRTKEIPAVNPLNPKYRALIAVWKRLPLPVANLVGPPIARNFG